MTWGKGGIDVVSFRRSLGGRKRSGYGLGGRKKRNGLYFGNNGNYSRDCSLHL